MKIALMGTGHMGHAMATRLAECQFALTAYNRSAEKLTGLPESVATTTDSAQAIEQAEFIIMMVSDYSAIQDLLQSQSLHQKTVIQMGTIAPEQSTDLAKLSESAGGRYVEAPVLGSIPEAKTGTLLIMTGGDEKILADCEPILNTFSQSIRHIGSVGQAAAVKLALNQLIASLTSAFSLTLGFLQNAELNINTFMSILRESALYAPTFDKKLQKMLDRDFASANFPLQHLLKDVDLFLKANSAKGLDTSSLASISSILQQGCHHYAQQDYSSLYQIIHPE